MFGCSELRSRLTWVSRSMSLRRVRSASIGFVNFVVSGSHWMMYQRQLSCTLLLRLASTIAMLSTFTMKITNFHYSACIEIEWNMEIAISDCQFIWRRVQSVQCPAPSSRRIAPRSRDIPVLAHAMSGFSIYRPRKLYPWLLKSINKLSGYTWYISNFKNINLIIMTSLQWLLGCYQKIHCENL